MASNVNKNPHAVALGKLGGSKKTKAKEEAARLNGKKGGRPRKFNMKETIKKIAKEMPKHYEQ